MTFERNLPALPSPWALPNKLNTEYAASKTSIGSRIKTILTPFSGPARELGLPNNFVKIAKNTAQYFVTLEGSSTAKTLIGHCNVIGDSVKVFNVAKGIDDIATNASMTNKTGIDLHQRNLGIASGFFQLIVSGSAAAKLLNTFDVISLSGISEALGTTAVLPFSVFTSAIEIIKNAIDIANKSLKIHASNKKAAAAKAKQKKFKNETTSAEIGKFFEKHLDELHVKQIKAFYKLTNQTEFKTAKNEADKALADYMKAEEAVKNHWKSDTNVVSKLLDSIELVRTKWAKEAELFKATASCDKEFAELEKTQKKLTSRVTKFKAWTNMKDHFENTLGGIRALDSDDKLDKNDPLNQLLKDKTARQKAVRKDCRLENIKDGISIALSVAATIGLIAVIVLTFTGVGTIPVLLTMTTLWLILAIAGIGSTLYGKYNKPIGKPTINFHKYATFAAA